MVFQEEQYRYIKLVAPTLSSFAEVMELLRRDQEKGNIELLFRSTGRPRTYQFEGVIAHAGAFMPAWEKLLFQTKIVAYNPIASVKYDFKSNPFSGLNSLRILEDYCSHAHACCDNLGLERNIRVNKDISSEDYRLQGWLQGPVRNALLAHDYLRDSLGKGIGVAGTLSYR